MLCYTEPSGKSNQNQIKIKIKMIDQINHKLSQTDPIDEPFDVEGDNTRRVGW